MLNVVAGLAPGKSAAIKVLRKGRAMELKLTIGKRPHISAPQPDGDEQDGDDAQVEN
jgi:hypothetical protein